MRLMNKISSSTSKTNRVRSLEQEIRFKQEAVEQGSQRITRQFS